MDNKGKYLIGGILVLAGLAVIFQDQLKSIFAKATPASNPTQEGSGSIVGGFMNALPQGIGALVGKMAEVWISGNKQNGF